jgi:putative ABC transport system permease protein
MLASFKTVEVANPDVLTVDGWGDASYYTYLLLKKGVDQKHSQIRYHSSMRNTLVIVLKLGVRSIFIKLQPLSDIHLQSNLQYELAPTGNAKQVYIFQQ